MTSFGRLVPGLALHSDPPVALGCYPPVRARLLASYGPLSGAFGSIQRGRAATADAPAVAFTNVDDATLRNSNALPGTHLFLDIAGAMSRGIRLIGNDLGAATTPYRLDTGVKRDAVVRTVP